MAPEVALQDPYGKSADAFSYAMVLYELIMRKKPPQRKLRDGYAFHAEQFEDQIPPDTPRQLWDLLVACAATNPDERPTFPEIAKRLKAIEVPEDSESEGEEEDSEVGSDSESEYESDEEESSEYSSGSGEEEVEEEKTESYIARGREITEVTKIITTAITRKRTFCKFECSIPKKVSWRSGSEVPIKVKIENQSNKTVNGCRLFVQASVDVGKKKPKISKSKPMRYKSGFPVRSKRELEDNIPFVLPAIKAGKDDKCLLTLEFFMGRGFGKTKCAAYLPVEIQ